MKTRTQPFFSVVTAATLLVICGGAAGAGEGVAQVSSAAVRPVSGSLMAVPVRAGRLVGTLNMRIESPRAASSKAVATNGRAFLLRNQVVVRTENEGQLRAAIDAIAAEIPGVAIERPLGDAGVVWAINAPDVATAAVVAERLGSMSFVSHAAVDSGPWVETPRIASHAQIIAHQERVRALVAPGVTPVGLPGARGVGDPLFNQQWHLSNFANPGRDINVLPVYGRGLTGAGVTVGITAFSEGAIQPDHIDYGERFDSTLSMVTNPAAGYDDYATFYAGLIGATMGNGIGGQGVAPGVRLASMIYGTDIREEQTYAWKNNQIDIKVHPRADFVYTAPDDGYSPGMAADYVMTALENSLRLGRDFKGVIHVFSTGFEGTFPSTYLASGDGWQDIFDNIGAVGVSVTNDYMTIPMYPGGMVHNYPPAGHRNTFVIAGVGEDNQPDPFSTMGTGIFASVYSSTANEILFGPGIGRGLTSTVSGDGFQSNVIDDTNASSAAIAAGIFALMLEANPNLTIRDIQHIIADTAVTTGLDYDFFNPYVLAVPAVMALGGTSNWGSNGSFKIHSDQYGFGLIDADAAVEAALNWTSPGRLYVLDSGLVTPEEPIVIQDAETVEVSETSSTYTIFGPATIPFCLRQNFVIEAIEVELTILGEGGGNDLIISLTSPYGARSNLHYPLTVNPTGTTFEPPANDNEADTGTFSNVGSNGQAYAFYKHNFVTYKHWDELSGGRWTITIWDVGPDTELTEGQEPSDTDPGYDHVTDFGFPLTVPPNPDRDEKSVVSYRIRIYGTDPGLPVFTGCAPGETNCPGDLNGDGVVNPADLALFLEWYTAGDLRADVNSDGTLDYLDIVAFRGMWRPGFCGRSSLPGARPVSPPAAHPSDPVVRPF